MLAENKSERHRDYSADWWTPPEWMEWVKETFGTPNFCDPCPADWNPDDGSSLDTDAAWGWCNYVNHPGSRGSTAKWWRVTMEAHEVGASTIWCAFNVEQLRHMRPSPFDLPGWLIMPRTRIGFIWGGPSDGKRVYGQPGKSPGNWTVFWSSVKPAPPPVECVIVRTGE